MKLCLPANFNKDTLEKLSAINNQKEIYEVYGNLNPSPLLNSGREIGRASCRERV